MDGSSLEPSTWLPALTGLLGVLLGSIMGFFGKVADEYVRRRNRRESYAPLIFAKRLEVHEALASLIFAGSVTASDLIDDQSLSDSERHLKISELVMAIAIFVDQNSLYLDEELGVHCTALFMGIEDIATTTGVEKEDKIQRYNSMRREALRMIAEESGIAEVNRLFKSIYKPSLSGPVIERIRDLKKQKAKGAGS